MLAGLILFPTLMLLPGLDETTYEYREGGHPVGKRIYQEHPDGFKLIYDETSLILGQNENEITIEIWDYVISEGELSFERLSLWGYGAAFDGFDRDDNIALNLRLPVGDEDARTLVAMPTFSLSIFSVHILKDDSVQLNHNSSTFASALYTGLLQHRGNYSHVLTLGDTGRF